MNDSRVSSSTALHRKRFGRAGSAYQAPGRVNLIGEHTDTSEGFVMPAALDLNTVSVLSPRSDSKVLIYSANFDEQVSLDLKGSPFHPRQHWSDYPAGVLWSLHRSGVSFDGFDMTISGDVPTGAGLSSSASVEVAVAVAVLAHAKTTLPKPTVAKICQSAENDFIGAQSGIMDQFASCCGVKDHAILLDCRSLKYEPLPVPEDVMLVICNSMMKHALSDGGAYNQRRAEVREGVRMLQKWYPEMHTLRDLSEQELRARVEEMPDNIFRRCLHVVTENGRVLHAAEALRKHDFSSFGRLMVQAHESMRDNYEASCAEADILVDLAMRQPGCYGARITGAGFGGCTVSLVAVESVESFVENVRSGYREATKINAEVYLSHASDGAGPIEQS
jgi:galactokinase